jgi:hypothetical protein
VSWWQNTLAVVAAGLVAGGLAAWLSEWWKTRMGRLNVLLAVEDETAKHVPDLVPEQRQPVEDAGPSWWAFVPQQRDGEPQ